ncbi:MAG: hypothetical protein A3G20_04230 [Acidobacteria bacterium RIFCSPLOWO2_12_FULL_59_11]|nr:MAG: hypothetical protein A3G20_04230 [Acidobacteria bacterium RIFCSPLOWO2_12_FULL_59_11]
MNRRYLCALILLAIVLGSSQQASAIPAFARKYQTSCSTCHIAYPVLNSFGKAFKAAGYRIPAGDEGFTKDEPVSLGAPAWKQVWPDSLWPSDIPGHSVAAFWLSSRFRVNKSAKITNEFDGLNELYVLAAGTLGESFSFFGELEVIDGGTVPTSFGAALPRAFFSYNHPSHKFNVTYGLFEPRAVLTPTRLRLMRMSDLLSNRYGMPPTGNSFSLAPNQRGVELWGNVEGPGNKGGLEWFAGVVNGRDAGTPPGAGAYGAAVSGLNSRLQAALAREGRTGMEVNSDKDFYFGANFKIGGMGVLGGGVPEAELVQADNYIDNSATLGAFYYRGQAPALVTEAGKEIFDRDGNNFHRVGAKVDLNIHKGNILYGFQLNRDQVRNAGRNFDQLINMVEARYVLYPWLIPAVRFENLNPNYGVAFNRTTVHVSILARANVRISLEGVLSQNSTTDPIRDYRRYEGGNDRQFHARLDFAF